jgi:hypothetical protein
MPPASSREKPLVSADHRKPVVAFVMLALAAALVVGIQQAEAMDGRFLAAAVGTDARVQGTVPPADERPDGRASEHLDALGPAFRSLRGATGHTGAGTGTLELVVGTAPTGSRHARQADHRRGGTPPGPGIRARTAPGARAGTSQMPEQALGESVGTPGHRPRGLLSKGSASSQKTATPRPAMRVGHPSSRDAGHNATSRRHRPRASSSRPTARIVSKSTSAPGRAPATTSKRPGRGAHPFARPVSQHTGRGGR